MSPAAKMPSAEVRRRESQRTPPASPISRPADFARLTSGLDVVDPAAAALAEAPVEARARKPAVATLNPFERRP